MSHKKTRLHQLKLSLIIVSLTLLLAFTMNESSYAATADISVTKTFYYEDLGQIVLPDNPLDRYWKFFTEVVVTNNGPDTATNVVITDLLSPGLMLAPFDPFGSWFVTYTGQNPDTDPPENNPSFDNNTRIWTIPSMNSGDVWVLDFFTIANTTGIVYNDAVFDPNTADQFDPDPTNDVGHFGTYVPTGETQLTTWFQNDSTYGSPHTTTAHYLDNLYAFIKLYNVGPDKAKYITIIDDFSNDLIYNSALMETSYDGGLTWATDPNAYWLDFGTYAELEWFPNDIPLNGMALFRIPGVVNVGNKNIVNNASETQRTFNPLGDNTDNQPYNQPGFNTLNATTTLNIPQLQVTSTNPANNAVNVALNKIIKINFNQNIKFGSSPIELYATSSGTPKPFTSTINGNVLSITPQSLLSIGTMYTVILHPNSITDLSGNGLASQFTTRFTTTTSPVVKSTSPVNNSQGVALNKVIQFSFDKNIKLASNPWIELKNQFGTAKAFTTSVSGNKLNIKATSQFAKGTKYMVILHSNSVKDTTGLVGLAAPYTLVFTTTTSPVVKSTSPVNNAVGVHTNKVIEFNFDKNIKLASNPWIELKNQYGTSKPYTTSVNGNKLNIKTTSNYAKGTRYTAVLHSNSVTDTTGTAGLAAPYTTKFTTTT